MADWAGVSRNGLARELTQVRKNPGGKFNDKTIKNFEHPVNVKKERKNCRNLGRKTMTRVFGVSF